MESRRARIIIGRTPLSATASAQRIFCERCRSWALLNQSFTLVVALNVSRNSQWLGMSARPCRPRHSSRAAFKIWERRHRNPCHPILSWGVPHLTHMALISVSFLVRLLSPADLSLAVPQQSKESPMCSSWLPCLVPDFKLA
jgi:hypothetical protein